MQARLSAVGLGAGLALITLGLTVGLARVYHLEQNEVEHQGPLRPLADHQKAPGSTKLSARLTKLELQAGTQAVFEICSADGLRERWQDALGFAVFQLEPMRLMLRVELDAAHLEMVRRNEHGGCLQLGSGRVEEPGRYSVDAVWPERPPEEALTRVPIRARVLARQPLSGFDHWPVAAIALGGLALLALGWSQHPRAEGRSTSETGSKAESPGVRWRDPRPPYLWIGAALLAVVGVAQLPLWGPTLGLSKGLLIALLQVAVVIMWKVKRGTLPLSRPRHPRLTLVAACCACPLLVANARWALRFIPSSGQAPIETFISWPSGMLAFALLGALLPLVEELFFRGFLLGALLTLGTWPAAALSLLFFWALHLQQSWGNWGALWAILATGVVATGLRLASGSVLPGALAHMLYNLVLSLRL
ncbi:MAG: type II CAAX endopeptidase family protein [Myxococcales bacterium]|nr:type II CAAX endopeptidase family protein [Myxococcales bacterium]